MLRFIYAFAFAALVALSAGCGPSGGTSPSPSYDGQPRAKAGPAAGAEDNKFVLASEPAGVKGVIAVRKDAKDGEEVAVAGQVGGSTKPFIKGRASFLLVDPSFKPTAECDSPWDFCEYPMKELAAARLSVKFVDAAGKTVQSGARELFGLKELSSVVVKGKVSRDDKDNVVILASGIYVQRESK
ncbi:MAG: hypothetical protein U0840_26995 [Gemmataceae bacterium]